MKPRHHRRIIISGGGTGGHIFPAIAIADALKMRLEDADILFVGAMHRMEMKIVPEAGYRIIGLPVEGFRRTFSPVNIRVVMKLLLSLHRAGKIIREFNPSAVVGVGGYASAPVLRSAVRRRIPTLIQEQNAYAGLTNRWLARRVLKVCVAFEGMERYFPPEKIVLAGNPVREEIRMLAGRTDRHEARMEFGMNDTSRVMLVMGGSLGAKSINDAVGAGIEQFIRSDARMIWQCGRDYYQEAERSVSRLEPGKVNLQAFIKRMDMAYLAADLVVARAGAITLSELCHAGKPVILIPSPNVAEDHQTKNAKALVRQDAALHIPDHEAGSKMMNMALELLRDEKKRSMLAENIKSFAIPDSSERIAEEIIALIRK